MEQDAELARITSLLSEIAEYKRANEALQATLAEAEQAKREWESVVDAFPDLIALVDRAGNVMRANRAVEAWNLGSLTKVNGRRMHELVHGDCRDSSCYLDSFLKQAWEQTARRRSVEREAFDPILNRYLLIKARPMLGREQKATQNTIVVLQDITGRKQAEEEVKRLNDDLEHRASELAALNKAGEAMTSTLNFESVLKLVIGEVRGLLSAEGASVLLRDPASDELVFAASAGAGSEVLAGTRMPITAGIAGWVMRERRPVLVGDAQSDPRFYAAIDAKTNLTTRSLIAVPLRFKGAVWGVVEAINKTGGVFVERDAEMLEALARSAAIAIENAQLYQAEQELRRLVEQSRAQLALSEKLAATGRLAATVAHEVNNPLQAIYNCLQMMRDFQLEPDEQREYLQTAIEEVERLTSTVGRVLDLSRQPQQGTRPMQLNETVEKVLALTGKYLQHRHIVLQRNLMPDLPSVLATPDELVQVFLNLVLNAADAMAEGGILHVTSRLADDRHLTVAFSDTGNGIPSEHLNRIFEPFFSTKDGGTGMGLAISNDLVTQHGGEITVESQVGKGTTFTVRLPVVNGRA